MDRVNYFYFYFDCKLLLCNDDKNVPVFVRFKPYTFMRVCEGNNFVRWRFYNGGLGVMCDWCTTYTRLSHNPSHNTKAGRTCVGWSAVDSIVVLLVVCVCVYVRARPLPRTMILFFIYYFFFLCKCLKFSPMWFSLRIPILNGLYCVLIIICFMLY